MSAELTGEARTIYRLLQAGRNHDAIARLHGFVDAADAASRPDLCARGLAWLAQAQLGIGDLSGARVALRRAAAIATAIDDTAGLQAIRELRQQVGARAMAAPPAAPAPDETLIGQACAAFDAGDAEGGLALATEAHATAQTPRDEVLALLAIARAPGHAERAVLQAALVADAASDFNLVHAVSRAARAAGVSLPAKVF